MAINSIKFITSPSATATNGSDIITITGNADCRNVYSGSAVFLGTRHVVEAVSGTAPDVSGNSTIKLRTPWSDPTTTANLTVFNTIEGLAEAIRRAREIVEGTQTIADQLIPLAELTTLGFIEKTGSASYSTFQATATGKALLGADTAADQRTALGLGTAAVANVTTNATDSTAGRLLKVGDFGVGTQQIYTLGDNSGFGLGVSQGGGASLTYNTNGNLDISPRSGFDAVLTNGKLLSPNGSAFVGTVSNSGLGAIIQRGSNANGEFVRFADGTQICTFSLKSIHTSPIFIFNYEWVYPATFSASYPAPSLSGSFWCIEQNVAFRRGILARGNSEPTAGANSTFVTGSDFSSGNFDESLIQLTAIGRWF